MSFVLIIDVPPPWVKLGILALVRRQQTLAERIQGTLNNVSVKY